jgi:hypothetical protein
VKIEGKPLVFYSFEEKQNPEIAGLLLGILFVFVYSLELGANPRCFDQKGNSMAHQCVLKKASKVLEVLVKKGSLGLL